MDAFVIGRYSSLESAQRVRADLVARGIAEDRVFLRGPRRAQPSEPLPEDQGLAGFVGRMFSGAMGDPSAIEKYLQGAGEHEAIVGVRVARGDLDRVVPAMRRDGTVMVHDEGGTAAPPPTDVTRGADADRESDAVASARGVEGSALPNAATAWNTSGAGSPPAIGVVGHDPGRPRADIEDAGGLGTDADRRRSDRGTPSSPALARDDGNVPDALGHRTDRGGSRR